MAELTVVHCVFCGVRGTVDWDGVRVWLLRGGSGTQATCEHEAIDDLT